MHIYTLDSQLIEAGAIQYTLATAWYWFARRRGEYDRSRVCLGAIDNAFTHMVREPPLFVIDIEQWDLAQPAEREHAICNLRVAALRSRQYLQHAPMAFYRLLPERNYWAPVRQYQGLRDYNFARWQEGVQLARAWRDRNTANAADLLSVVDAVCPSLYQPSSASQDDPVAWCYYAQANLDEAQRLADGRPVIAFLSPQIGGIGDLMPPKQMVMQLEFCQAHGCKGAVIYESGGATGDWRAPIIEFMEQQNA